MYYGIGKSKREHRQFLCCSRGGKRRILEGGSCQALCRRKDWSPLLLHCYGIYLARILFCFIYFLTLLFLIVSAILFFKAFVATIFFLFLSKMHWFIFMRHGSTKKSHLISDLSVNLYAYVAIWPIEILQMPKKVLQKDCNLVGNVYRQNKRIGVFNLLKPEISCKLTCIKVSSFRCCTEDGNL